ncbi:myosin regulatory light chain 10 isoform X1 [Manis pentadactyla]|uniref:myosin regulatory light chain 10 isoform X1 n=2 Tax=Manis pentadactyla TaxID=143292 RepID=UPI00255CC618|nr:myosin regulatory light chain 10 isoform X1 [Manis pentadactyla]
MGFIWGHQEEPGKERKVGPAPMCSPCLISPRSRSSKRLAFTIMDQNRDGFIDKEDLRDTFAALGRINVKNEELDIMVKEAPGPINFTVFLTMFGEKLKGTDPEETILHAFKVFDTEGKGFIKADFIKEKLMTQADRFSEEEIKQMFAAFPPDVCGNLDYRNLCYVITHGEEKD